MAFHRTTFLILCGCLIGGAVAYEGAALLGCAVLWRVSNLCGLPAALFGLPIGLVAGGLLARRLARRR